MTNAHLSGIRAAVDLTLAKKATPHRVPDFDAIEKLVEGDPEIKGKFWFIEEHNTGYPGVLERWCFTVPAKDGGRPLSFWADLLPGLISSDKAAAV